MKFNKFVENILAESSKDLYTKGMKNELIHTKEIVDAINNLSTYADCDFDEILECLKGRIFSAEEIGQIDTYLKRVSLGINS